MSTSVQVHFELIELPPEVSFTLLLGAAAQESWVDREVDLQIELQLLANKVLMAQHDWHMAVPKDEEVVSFALIKGVTHLLDVALRILAEGTLQLSINVHANLFVQSS